MATTAPTTRVKVERPRQRARMRARIKTAARDLFAQGGYLSCSIGDIVRAAEVSRAVFYLYFKDKQDLLLALIRDSIITQRRMLSRIALRTNPTDEDLRDWIRYYIRNIAMAMDTVRLLDLASFVDPEFGRAPYLDHSEGVLKIARTNRAFHVMDAQGEIRRDRLIELNILILSLGKVAVTIGHHAWVAEEDETLDILVRQFRHFIEEGVKAESNIAK